MSYRADTKEVTLTIRTNDKVSPPRPAWWRRARCLLLGHRWHETVQFHALDWLVFTGQECDRCGRRRFWGREL